MKRPGRRRQGEALMPADGTAAPRLWSPAAGDGRLDRRDLWRLALVGLLALALGLLGVETLEFYRHTEADRTLIGWEMLERGDFLVPHLLGSIILTKPPLFYWLMAAGIKLSGQATEGVARLPSVLAGVLLALVQYTAVRRAGGTRQVAVLFALVLSSGAAFLIDIQRAEIEMVFGFFSAAALYSLYFSMEERSASLTVAGYLFLALAFLTKGPPILFFLLVTAAFFALWLRFRRRPESGRMTGGGRRLVAAHLMGAGMALALAGGWLLALAHRVGWPALVEQVNVELVQRVVADSARGRGWLFYPWRFSGTLMPWTPFLLAGLALPFFQRRGWAPYRERAGAGWPFFIFNLTVVLSGFLVVSLSQGKSSRYLFPVYASASMLAGFALLWLRGSRLLHRILGMASLLALLAPLPLLAAAATLSLEGVAHSRMILAAVLLSFALVGFGLTLL
ncbi:MAG: ArnT family glycosyltransferase, partial [Acidobacteriota bacterium]